MQKRRALGRGLQALIPDISPDVKVAVGEEGDAKQAEQSEAIVYLDISDIKAGPYQPRSDFNEEKMQELIASIKEKGVVQPILVRRKEAGYEIIAGERRLRAVHTLGIRKIPAIMKEVDDVNAIELAIIENVQREDLNPIEEAKAYERLLKEFGFTLERIARAVGKEKGSVGNVLRLLNLPAKIQMLVLDDTLTMGHARALINVTDPDRQMKLCQRIIKRGLSVRETEHLVRPHLASRKTSAYRQADPHLRAAEDELQKALGTRVRIQRGTKRGKIIIEYFSPQDLERIIEIVKR